MYGESYKKIAVPEDVPQDLKALYVKKGFGIEHDGTKEEWAMLRTHEMADVLARDLAAMAPLQQLMQRMRRQAQSAQEQAARELEAQRRAEAARAERPAVLTVRSADEFDF